MVSPARSEDRLFLLDASGSMGGRLGKARKIDLVKQSLLAFCLSKWPVSYYDLPLRVGIVAFRLLGTPGRTVYEVIVPLYPSPPSLELFRLQELSAKGGSFVADGLAYARVVTAESEREVRRVKFISDGTYEGPDPLPVAEEIRGLGARLDCIELSESPSSFLKQLADRGGGEHRLVRNLDELSASLD